MRKKGRLLQGLWWGALLSTRPTTQPPGASNIRVQAHTTATRVVSPCHTQAEIGRWGEGSLGRSWSAWAGRHYSPLLRCLPGRGTKSAQKWVFLGHWCPRCRKCLGRVPRHFWPCTDPPTEDWKTGVTSLRWKLHPGNIESKGGNFGNFGSQHVKSFGRPYAQNKPTAEK